MKIDYITMPDGSQLGVEVDDEEPKTFAVEMEGGGTFLVEESEVGEIVEVKTESGLSLYFEV